MENASKALVMAGGIMIAIIVISTLLYASSTWGIIPQKQSETKKIDQIAEFNLDFESYNRQAVYGVDLVSVISKAIENNKKYNVENSPNDSMYINIEFSLISDVDTTETKKRVYLNGNVEEQNPTIYSTLLHVGRTYTLRDTEVLTLIQNIQEQTKVGRTKTDINGKYQEVTITQAGGSAFKTRVFACTDVEYNTENRKNKSYAFQRTRHKLYI